VAQAKEEKKTWKTNWTSYTSWRTVGEGEQENREDSPSPFRTQAQERQRRVEFNRRGWGGALLRTMGKESKPPERGGFLENGIQRHGWVMGANLGASKKDGTGRLVAH